MMCDNLWKRTLLSVYYYGSYPYRAAHNARAAAAGQAPLMVLFYHRVADYGANDWTCPFDLFARQMEWLQAHFDLVSLPEIQARIRRGRNDRPAVSITFDDGYADNCRQALPLLISRRIPCTYFVASRHVFEGIPFPHDVECGDCFAPNTLEQLRELAAAGIEIGCHTRNHADLGRISDPDVLHDEVVTAGEELAAAVGTKIRYFAFPYGLYANLNAAAFRMAKQAGYEGVCSAYGGYNFPGDDAFHLQRIHGDDDMLRMKNWLSVDPRKLSVLRYPYERLAPEPELKEILHA
jgi:peptidoglycan/xylan/chitin deacetylase (PgdA/CDA1 family)